jgi:hypothetical protein
MNNLRPFNSSDLDKLFEELFDGVDVLPSKYLDIYEQYIREGKYLEAAQWLVPVAWRDYKRLEKAGKAWHEPLNKRGADMFVVDVPYDSESGLDLYSAYKAEGTANQLRKTDLDDFDVDREAD